MHNCTLSVTCGRKRRCSAKFVQFSGLHISALAMYQWNLFFSVLMLARVAHADKVAPMAMKSFDLLHVKSNKTSDRSARFGLETESNAEVGKGLANEALCGMPVVKDGAASHPQTGETAKGKWPWQAMIVRFSEKLGYYYFICSGTLIQKRWILTAAHCFNGEPISHTLVIMVDRHNEHTGKSTQTFATGAILCNTDYNKKNNKNDVCLIKLAVEVEYSSYAIPACLPEPGERAIMGDTCQVTGWDDTQANAVRETEVSIMEKDECLQLPRNNDTFIETTHFCAKYPEGSKTCHGESGGPLVCERIRKGKSHYVLYGIKSIDAKCGQKGTPEIFTEVEEFVQWTDQTIGNAPDTDMCFAESSIYDCGSVITTSGTVLRTPVTDIESWLYPHNYDCSWDIRAPRGYKIGLEFLCFFHVEKTPGSLTDCNDFMTIASRKAGIDILYCGSRLLDPMVLDSDEATVGFHSNPYQSGAGFVIRVNFIATKKTSSKRSAGDPPPKYREEKRKYEDKWRDIASAASPLNGRIALLCLAQLTLFFLWR